MAWLLTKAEEERRKVNLEQATAYQRQRESKPPDHFNPRTEVSADAKHVASKIVFHMWMILVLLPLAFGTLYVVVTAR
jgi:hypothetical protein